MTMHALQPTAAVLINLAVGTMGMTDGASAQRPPDPQVRVEPPFPFRLPFEHMKSGQHAGLLRAILDMRARETEAMADPAVKMAYVDILPWYLVAAGEHRAAAAMETLAREAFRYPRGQRTNDAPFGEMTAVPAVAMILEAARERRVVMLNEEHRSSVQRAFLNEIIEGLAAAGFTHLAMEAISAGNVEGINERGFVILSRDVYTLDPAMADAIRRARAAGRGHDDRVIRPHPSRICRRGRGHEQSRGA